MARLFLVISSGRSGTQWLARALRETYSDLAVVRHEPLTSRYRGREFYRLYDRLDEMREVPAIDRHLRFVAGVLRTEKSYVETGSQVYAAIPLFLEMFGRDVGLVHLTRHPVPAAISLMTLVDRLSEGDWGGEAWEALGLPDPTTPGALQRLSEREWREASPYRKCLFEWTEKQLYAEELRERYPDTPFMRLSSEELFGGGRPAIARLLSFLGLPEREPMFEAQGRRVDKARTRSSIDADWTEIRGCPETVAVARRLGFDPEDVAPEVLQQRYRTRLRLPLMRLRAGRRSRQRARYEQILRRLSWRVHDLPDASATATQMASLLRVAHGLVLVAGSERDPALPVLLAHDGRRCVVVADPTLESARLAREQGRAAGGRVLGVVADGEHLPFVTDIFDACIAEVALRDGGDDQLAVEELSRVLRQGAQLMLAGTNRAGLDMFYQRARVVRGRRSEQGAGARAYGWREIERVTAEGFRVRGRSATGWDGGWKARVGSRLVRLPLLRRVGRKIVLDLEVK